MAMRGVGKQTRATYNAGEKAKSIKKLVAQGVVEYYYTDELQDERAKHPHPHAHDARSGSSGYARRS